MLSKKQFLLIGVICIFLSSGFASESKSGKVFTQAATDNSPEGFPEFKIAADVMPQTKWPETVSTESIMHALNFTPLNISVFPLTPEQKGLGFIWPDKKFIAIQYNGAEWSIKTNVNLNITKPVAIKSKNIELAFFGTGIIIRDNSQISEYIDCGPDLVNVRMLIPVPFKKVKFHSIEILQPMLAYFFINEARKNLQEAEVLFKTNTEDISATSGGRLRGKNLITKWISNYEILKKVLNKKQDEILTQSGSWIPLLMNIPSIRDRYSYFIQFSGLGYIATSYMGDFYQKNWFLFLNGMPEYEFAVNLKKRTERAVERACRLNKTTFKRGLVITAGKENILAAGLTGSFNAVPREKSYYGSLTSSYCVELCRGEYENLQLVLAAGEKDLDNVSVSLNEITGPSEILKENCQLFSVQYIHLAEPYIVNLPVSAGGDGLCPDPLQPMSWGTPISIPAKKNQPLWITIYAPVNVPPGNYEIKLCVKMGANISMPLPVKVKVYDFALGKNRLESAAGFRHSEVERFYGKESARKYIRNFEKVLLEHYCNPVDIYNRSPDFEDFEGNVKDGITFITLPRYENLAAPRMEMPEFTKLYASNDGRNFENIAGEVKLVPQGDPQITDWDLVVTPKQSIAEYKFIKLHYSEKRGWENRCRYSYFRVENNNGSIEILTPENKRVIVSNINFIKQDKNPIKNEKDAISKIEKNGLFTFDSVADDSNLSSILIEKEAALEIKNIRLKNSNRKICIETMTDSYRKFKENGNDQLILFSYGYDEALEGLNLQMLSALKTCKTLFPDVQTGTTSMGIHASPEVYKYLDIVCPNNSRFYVLKERELCERYGTRMWTYTGAGGYYPFPNFERVDQPFIYSRAFFWPCIKFRLSGWLYWDINFWYFNNNAVHAWPEIWEIWNPTYSNTTNGIAALIYPGPEGTPIPSIRLKMMRDGIEDYNYFMLAEELLSKRRFADENLKQEITAFIEKSKNRLSPGFSGFLEDPSELQKIRHALSEYIVRMNQLPE